MSRFWFFAFCWLARSTTALGDDLVTPRGAIPSRPLPTRVAVRGTLFEAVPPAQSGVQLIHEFPRGAPHALMQEQGSGCGVAVGDVDGDGLPDLFVTNYDRGNRLYRNLGGWRFDDITDQAGVRALGRWCAGASFADLDNDGDLDLYVCCFNEPNLLFVNRGGGTFDERAHDLGLDWTGASVMAAIADYDGDGRLDVFLLTHRDSASAAQRLPSNARDATERGILGKDSVGRSEITPGFRDLFSLQDKGGGRMEIAIAGQADQLFHQETSGNFRNVTEASGIRGQDLGLGVAWWDYDGDGRSDLYVANDHQTPDRLWRNLGDGTFTNVAPAVLPSIPFASMGVDTADVDNDGWVDLLATEMAGFLPARRMVDYLDLAKLEGLQSRTQPPQVPRNMLFLGTGGTGVREAARLAGIQATDWTWSPKFGDFDNDGWIDLFVANGMAHDYIDADLLTRMVQPKSPGWRAQPPRLDRNLAFRNRGGLRFAEVGAAWGLDRLSASFGAAVADFDADGNLDLAFMNLGAPVALYRNREATGHRIALRLRGTHDNSWGVGAVVQAETSHGRQTRCLQLASGFLSANEPIIHFGLGADTRIARLTVRWPSGTEESFRDLAADRFYTITEASGRRPLSGTPVSRAAARTDVPWFQVAPVTHELRHRERPFDDFAREPLLPERLSRLGPGLAVGDIDGDGDDDLYLGGAAGQAGMIGVHEAGGRFRRVVFPAFEKDRDCEDMGALFLDVDADGDLDLFVVSGGVEADAGSAAFQDRLYLNDGRGGFTAAPVGSLPVEHDSGGVACAADFDRDGDLDLFVGGRLVPGDYLARPRSRLLINQGGRFVDGTADRAPALLEVGMITGAVWADVDDDGWIDLVTASDWGPVEFFGNQSGRLVRRADPSGLGRLPGRWQGLAAVDLDGDGHLDLLAANRGLNEPFPPIPESPVRVWRLPVEGSPSTPILEAFRDQGAWRPQRRRERLIAGLPSLGARFPSIDSLAHATVPQMFPDADWDHLTYAEAVTAETGCWFNDGRGHFTFRALDRQAQLAPSFGVLAQDFDGDGQPEVLLVGNDRGRPAEYGPAAGGLGLLLRAEGAGRFYPVPPSESGVFLPDDVRALALLDLDGNGVPDVVAAQNNGDLVALKPMDRPDLRWYALRLRGAVGNPSAVGAQVEVTAPGVRPQLLQVAAGGGYLSQSTATLFFARPRTATQPSFAVRWPDGTRSVGAFPPGRTAVTFEYPPAEAR